MNLTTPDPIPELLNTVQALLRAGIGTYGSLAKDIGEPVRTVEGWFGRKQDRRPSGAAAVKLLSWAARQTKGMSCTGTMDRKTRQLHSRYRSEYGILTQQFPVAGKNGDV